MARRPWPVYRRDMRSSLICVAMVVAATPAAASPESDVEALVRTTVDHAAEGTAWLAISKQERDGVIQFGFTVYAVQEKGEWRWKSIQFADDQVPERD